MTFYVCNEDQPNSALYVRRERKVDWWGKFNHKTEFPISFNVVEYKRITRAPGVNYSSKVSSWFAPTFSEIYGKYIDIYSPLSFFEGWKIWLRHQLR